MEDGTVDRPLNLWWNLEGTTKKQISRTVTKAGCCELAVKEFEN